MSRTRMIDPVQQVREHAQAIVGVRSVRDVARSQREAGRFIGGHNLPRTMLTDELPATDPQYYGWLVIVNGGSGVADGAHVLLRTAADTLNWVRVDSLSGGGTPSIAIGGAHVSAANITGFDRNASVNWTTSAAPANGVQVAITFSASLGTTNYAVLLTATEDDAAVRNLYATAKGNTGFQIAIQSAPAAIRFHSCDYLIAVR